MKRIQRINQDTMNAMLPAIPPEFEKTMREMIHSMPAERKEQTMKRKLSVGFVLAVVLALIAVGALAAALLGGKDFVDQVMAPKAAQTQSDKYTSQEVQEILRIARENNLALDDHVIARLNDMKDGYWKDELMRLFVKAEYGFYPSAWPIEVQHWYEEMLEACGQGDGLVGAVLPEGDEISQERAVEIALRHLNSQFGADEKELTDESLYLRHMTYYETKWNPQLTTREWWIMYQPKDLYHPDYAITISPQGEVKECGRTAGILGTSAEMPGQFIEDRFGDIYGNGYGVVGIDWTSDILLKYQEALKLRVAKEGDDAILKRERHILRQTYLIPDATMISHDQAIQLAKERAGDQTYTEKMPNAAMAVLLMGKNGPAWKVTLQTDRALDLYLQLDARTGDVQFFEQDAGSLWRAYVSEEYWRENKPEAQPAAQNASVFPGPTVHPDGKPGYWYSDIAPKWYWEKLDAVGYGPDSANKLYSQWMSEYGLAQEFWPLEAQAIDFWYHEYDGSQDSVPGLPRDTDIAREEAVGLAKQAFQAQYEDKIPNLDAPSLLAGASYFFHALDSQPEINVWRIVLQNGTGGVVGTVHLDAATGEVYYMEAVGIFGGNVDRYPQPQMPVPTPLPDGRPWIFGSGAAPAGFWPQVEKLAAEYGVTVDNVEQKALEWNQQYEDAVFWPLECQAVWSAFCPRAEDDLFLQILPQPGWITEEQAVQLAQEALLKECERRGIAQEWIDSLRVAKTLWNGHEQGFPFWNIQFMIMEHIDGWNDYWNPKGEVYINAETGEVYFAELMLYSNG